MTAKVGSGREPTGDGEDSSLVVAARAGDGAAWGALYARYAPVVHGVLLSRLASADAEDATQEVFVRAMSRLASLREPGALRAWLLTAARRAALDARRAERAARRAREARARDGAARGGGGEGAGVVSGVEAAGEAARVMAAIRALPAAYRETLVLRLVEGLTGPQIAARTGMTHGSVRVNLTRGMELLRERLRGGEVSR